MFLDLHDLIEVSGAKKPFACELDAERLAFPALDAFSGPVRGTGTVKNTAGIMTLTGTVTADMTVFCDRCGTVFNRHIDFPVSATLRDSAEKYGDEDEYIDCDDGDASAEELFPLDGDGIDVSDVMETCFILGMDQKFLCRPDCQGLCSSCGRNLNEGPCGCKKQTDPRMAVLGQLLDDIQEV